MTVVNIEAVTLPDKPLVLHKWTDVQSARVGDLVTFFLKYGNQGAKPIRDVVVSDSLTGRLEYIPGTSRSDRDAIFTTQESPASNGFVVSSISLP